MPFITEKVRSASLDAAGAFKTNFTWLSVIAVKNPVFRLHSI